MNKKTLGTIFFWLTLLSPIISFSLSSFIGESYFYGVAGIIRYSWIMLTFIPIGVISFVIGLNLKYNNLKYKKNIVIACICIPLLLILGSYKFIFRDFTSYDTNAITIIEEKTNLELTNDVKIATLKFDLYDISYARILNNESRDKFEQEIKNNELWQETISLEIEHILPLDVQLSIKDFDYFVFYNTLTGEYNKVPESEENDCVFIAYDDDMNRLIIVDNFKIQNNKKIDRLQYNIYHQKQDFKIGRSTER